MCTLFKYCFPFLPISRILCTSRRTDLFVKVTNVTKSNTVWVHFTATAFFPTDIHLSRPIPKESVRIETRCSMFKKMIIDWTNMTVTGISGIRIEMPNEAKISIFMDNDLTHITDDHFEIKLVARLLDQIYIHPIDVDPRGPYKHHLVVRVDTGADVNCMNEKTFKRLFSKVKLSVCPHEIQNFGNSVADISILGQFCTY